MVIPLYSPLVSTGCNQCSVLGSSLQERHWGPEARPEKGNRAEEKSEEQVLLGAAGIAFSGEEEAWGKPYCSLQSPEAVTGEVQVAYQKKALHQEVVRHCGRGFPGSQTHGTEFEEAPGQLCWSYGLIFGWPCLEPGAGLNDPCGCISTWNTLWFQNTHAAYMANHNISHSLCKLSVQIVLFCQIKHNSNLQ